MVGDVPLHCAPVVGGVEPPYPGPVLGAAVQFLYQLGHSVGSDDVVPIVGVCFQELGGVVPAPPVPGVLGAAEQFLSQLGHSVGIGDDVLFAGGFCQVLDVGGGVLRVGVDCQVVCGGGVLCVGV
ncbi:hypothetical protein, partial [Mycobacterium kiyosense]|uniref:hypothetical protein n=2 Tax=Mycobacteriaceae TaxID=1762 RepID=UPI002230F525